MIKKYLELGVNLSGITKINNDLLEKPITYNSFEYFVKHDADLAEIWLKQKNHG